MTVDRSQGIGASEVPAVFGVSPWTTPVALWMEKVGLSPGRRETLGMSMGKVLEPVLVRELSAQLGVTFRHNAATRTHPDWPKVRLFATPDAYGPGRRSMAEIKVVSHHLEDWADGPPGYTRLQALGQLAVHPRAEVVHVAALIGGELRTWPVERDQADVDALVDGVLAWWRMYVVPEVSPHPENPDDTWALLRARVASQGDRQGRVATDEEEVAAAHLAVLQDQANDLLATITGVRLELAESAGDQDLAGHGWRASWVRRTLTDWAAVARDFGWETQRLEGYRRESTAFTVRRTKVTEVATAEDALQLGVSE